MAVTSINVTQVINKSSLPSSTKVALINAFSLLTDDIETLRSQYQALCTKLDSNHGAASDHAATVGVAAGTMKVKK